MGIGQKDTEHRAQRVKRRWIMDLRWRDVENEVQVQVHDAYENIYLFIFVHAATLCCRY